MNPLQTPLFFSKSNIGFARYETSSIQRKNGEQGPVEHGTGIDKNSFNIGSIKNCLKTEEIGGGNDDTAAASRLGGFCTADSLNHLLRCVRSSILPVHWTVDPKTSRHLVQFVD